MRLGAVTIWLILFLRDILERLHQMDVFPINLLGNREHCSSEYCAWIFVEPNEEISGGESYVRGECTRLMLHLPYTGFTYFTHHKAIKNKHFCMNSSIVLYSYYKIC